MKLLHSLVVLSVCLFAACGSDTPDFKPKPRGYHRIDLPEHAYVALPDTLPYWFEYSAHARLLNDSSHLAERFWFEVYYPQFGANIDISYRPIQNKYTYFRDYVNDSHKLAVKHNIKAYAIEESRFRTHHGYSGIAFELKGDVPTQFQFYVTDSVRHFLRASLYFPSSQLNDSLAPIIEYIKNDMIQMANTIQWRELPVSLADPTNRSRTLQKAGKKDKSPKIN